MWAGGLSCTRWRDRLYDPRQEPGALCKKFSWFLGEAHLHETMGGRAVEYALDYAWEKIAKQILGVYEKLVKNKKLVVQES